MNNYVWVWLEIGTLTYFVIVVRNWYTYFFNHSFIPDISIAPLQVHYY